MKELIERLEAADVGGYGLDHDVHVALVLARERIDRLKRTDLPEVTTSLDAALALAERVLPSFRFCLYTQTKDGACVLAADNDAPECDRWRFQSEAYTKTLPLALCIAILKAKSA